MCHSFHQDRTADDCGIIAAFQRYTVPCFQLAILTSLCIIRVLEHRLHAIPAETNTVPPPPPPPRHNRRTKFNNSLFNVEKRKKKNAQQICARQLLVDFYLFT